MLHLLADCLFDGIALRREPLCIDLDRGRIAAVRPLSEGDPTRPVPAASLDARGALVLPGLINAHVHIARGGMFGPVEPISIAQIAKNLEATLAAGVTTAGEMGCAAGLSRALRARTEADPTAGPSILCAGPILTAPGGYPLDWLPRAYARLGVAFMAGDEAEARRAVRRIADAGMDHVKLAIMHRSYADAPLPALSPPAARAAVKEAHALGLRAVAHAHSVADYRVALAAGADALMHSSFEPLDEDTVARVRDAGVPVCPTLWVFESVCLGAEGGYHADPRYNAAVSGSIRREWRRFAEAYAASGDVIPPGIAGGLPKARAREGVRIAAANLALLRDAGVPIAFGNDAAYGYSVHARPADELAAMQRAGMNAIDCLRAATSAAAALLGRADRGRIAPGLRADLVVADPDAARDIRALDWLRDVIVAGFRVPRGAPRPWPERLGTAAAVARGLGATAADAIRARGR